MREPIDIYRPPATRDGDFVFAFQTGADIREVGQQEVENFEFTQVSQIQAFGLTPSPSAQQIGIGWQIEWDDQKYHVEQISRPDFNTFWIIYGRLL